MTNKFLAAAIAGALLIPAAAQAQSRVRIPQVELFATVTGKWVLNPGRCRDIREDVRDARVTESRRDRREDRRDQRVADCPPGAYDFVPEAGQGPKYPVRVGRGRVQRRYRGRPMFINGDTIGPNGLPLSGGQAYTPPPPPPPTYAQPTYQQPAQPTYQQPTYQQPSYQQPTYQTAPDTTPTYQTPAPTPAPTTPSNYEVRNGVIYWLD